MSEVLIQKETLTDIGDAIREKTETTGASNPTTWPALIRGIETGSAESGRRVVTGLHDSLVDEYGFIVTCPFKPSMFFMHLYTSDSSLSTPSCVVSNGRTVCGFWYDGKYFYGTEHLGSETFTRLLYTTYAANIGDSIVTYYPKLEWQSVDENSGALGVSLSIVTPDGVNNGYKIAGGCSYQWIAIE